MQVNIVGVFNGRDRRKQRQMSASPSAECGRKPIERQQQLRYWSLNHNIRHVSLQLSSDIMRAVRRPAGRLPCSRSRMQLRVGAEERISSFHFRRSRCGVYPLIQLATPGCSSARVHVCKPPTAAERQLPGRLPASSRLYR